MCKYPVKVGLVYYRNKKLQTLERANGQIERTGTCLVLISEFKGLKHRKADRTVGVNCFVFMLDTNF